MPGCEPVVARAGSRDGRVVVHGFTGSPSSVRGVADAMVDAGFDVELPRLPGHGTTVDDMLATGWADWYGGGRAGDPRRCGRARRSGRRRRPEHGRRRWRWPLALEHPDDRRRGVHQSGHPPARPGDDGDDRRLHRRRDRCACRARAPTSPTLLSSDIVVRRHAARSRSVAARTTASNRSPIGSASRRCRSGCSRRARTTWSNQPTASTWRRPTVGRVEHTWLERSYPRRHARLRPRRGHRGLASTSSGAVTS